MTEFKNYLEREIEDLQDAQGGATAADSRMSAYSDPIQPFTSGDPVAVTWTLDAGAGTDISIDGADASLIHMAVGTYILQIEVHPQGGAVASLTVGLDGITTEGGDAFTTSPANRSSQWVRVTAPSLLQVTVHPNTADAASHPVGGIDILRIA